MPTHHPRRRSTLLPRNDDGLSLAEMVVAIAVVMVVLVSAGAAFTRMGQAQRSAEAADRGTQMIQDKLETIRKHTYKKVGCYLDDKSPVAPFESLCAQKTLAGDEVVVVLGGVRIGDESRGVAAMPREVVWIGENKYTVDTRVTFAARGSLALFPDDRKVPAGYPGLIYPTTQANAPYLAKRVTVSATWTLGGKTRTVSREWLRSPTSMEAVPPLAGPDSGLRCAEASPFCSISITDGQVLGAAPGFLAAKPIEFTIRMSVQTTAATIKHGTITKTLTLVNGGVTNGGYTLTYVIPKDQASGVVKPGANTVEIWVNTTGTWSGTWTLGYGEETMTKKVDWRFAPVSTSPYQMTNPHVVWDSSRPPASIASAGAAPEQSMNWLCVKNTDNKLWKYTGIVVDEANVDDMDGGTPPKLYVTGMDPAGPSPFFGQHPSAGALPYDPSGGYVVTRLTAPGSLNTIRWSYGFPADTVFPTTSTTSNIIISGERPGDGAAANASLTVPVHRVANATQCLNPLAVPTVPAAPSTPILTDGGNGSILADWGDVTGATSYNVYRKIGAGGTYPTTPTATTAVSNYTDVGLDGKLVYYYKVTAVNAAGESPYSPEAARTISYRSMIVGDNPVGYYELNEGYKPFDYFWRGYSGSDPLAWWPLRIIDPRSYNWTDNSDYSYLGYAYPSGTPLLGEQPGHNSVSGSTFFNGDANQVLKVNSQPIVMTPAAVTVEAWVKPLANGAHRMIVTKSTSGCCVDNMYQLDLDPTGKLEFLQANGPYGYAQTVAAVPNGSWHHVAATKSAAGLVTLYIDGVVAPSTLYSPFNFMVNSASTAAVLIGKRVDGYPFYGNISDLAIYTRDLTPAEISARYNGWAGVVEDSSLGGSYDGGYVRTPFMGLPGIPGTQPGGTAIAPGGDGNYVSLPGSLSGAMGNQPLVSAEGWVNLTARPGVGQYPTIITEDYPSGGGGVADIVTTLFVLDSGQAAFAIHTGGGWAAMAIDPALVPLNSWTHYVGVYDGAWARLYRNGVEVHKVAWAGGRTATGGGGGWYIGKRWDNADTLVGKVDEVALYAKALSPARVLAHYNAGK